MMRTPLPRVASAVALGALAFAGACKEATSVPDLNSLPSSAIASGLTPTTFGLLTTGLLNNDRANLSFNYLVATETMARDVYNIDPSETRYITEYLGAGIDPSAFSGGGSFLGLYQTVRTANTILKGLDALSSSFSTGEIAAARGLVRTIKAQELYRVFVLRGNNGIPIDVDRDINAAPAPLLCQTSALAAISALLDSANTDLQQAATANAGFPSALALPAGFKANGDFTTPAAFATYNRGLKGRVEVYRGILGRTQSYTDAITALNASFLNTTGDLAAGPYYTFSTATNETVNPLGAPTIYLNKAVGDSIQAGDLRSSKITTLAKARSASGVSTKYQSPLASTANLTGSIPILRNAELILLRAQANIGLGNLAAAKADIDVVRTKEGGLPAIETPTSAAAAIDAVLYEKRYSLLLTGGQRLVDLRSYGRLNSIYFAPEQAGDAFTSALPVPLAEQNARNGDLTLTCTN